MAAPQLRKTKFEKIEHVEKVYDPLRYNLVPGVNVVSYLPLQMCLYFNVYLSPFWMLGLFIGLELKFHALPVHFKYITVLLYVLMAGVEVARLYLGYDGNLREKVAELAGYWILTLFQLILVLYLMIPFSIILPIDWGVNMPMIVVLVAQVVGGVRALQLVARAQNVKYQVSQLLLRQVED